MLTGSIVAIATPMGKGGALDLPALGKLIDFHVANGTAGIVIVGTTGESPTVDFDEHCLLIRTAVEQARGRIPVIAGTGANSTSEAIELTAYAKEVGAQQLPVGRPVLQQADAGRPVPSLPRDRRERSICPSSCTTCRAARSPISPTTRCCASREVPGIVGIKDATADLGRGSELIKALAVAGRRDFAVYSGDDITALPLLLMGGHGVISVTANVAPEADGGNVQGRARPATSRRRARATTGCCRCTASCSSRRTRSP